MLEKIRMPGYEKQKITKKAMHSISRKAGRALLRRASVHRFTLGVKQQMGKLAARVSHRRVK